MFLRSNSFKARLVKSILDRLSQNAGPNWDPSERSCFVAWERVVEFRSVEA